MGPLIVIVADDLTGAADCGAACTAAGLSTVVVLGDASRARGVAAEVIAFDAETRGQPPEAAGRTIELAVRVLCSSGGVRVLYKKIDSTLRGNFAVEIAAARNAWGKCLAHGEAGDPKTLWSPADPAEEDLGRGAALQPAIGDAKRGLKRRATPDVGRQSEVQTSLGSPLAIVAPAFPTTGRTTRGGRMFLGGRPLEESEVWRSEAMSGVADVPTMLRNHGGLRTALVALETIRTDAGTLEAALAKHASSGVEAVVCDAETNDDLRAIAATAARLRRPVVLAGSAGLARHVPKAFGCAKKREAPPDRGSARSGAGLANLGGRGSDHSIANDSAAKRKPLLFVIGSRSQVSRQQLRCLSDESGMHPFTLPPATLRGGPDSIAWREAARRLDEALLGGSDDVALALGLDGEIDPRESAALSRTLGQFLLPSAGRVGGLFCTGGETACALLAAAGATGIRLAGEVEPGVPFGTVEGWRNLPIVTKAGAFGSPQTLVRCRAALQRLPVPPAPV